MTVFSGTEIGLTSITLLGVMQMTSVRNTFM